MNKQFKFFLSSAAVAVALVGAVSCAKDFSGDIDKLNSEVANLTTQLQNLQNSISQGEIVTNVEKIANGIKVTTNKGTFEIVNGRDGVDGLPGEPGKAGDPGKNGDPGTPGSVVTIGENGNWFIDGVDQNIPAKGNDGVDGVDGVDGDTIYYIPGEDGYFYKVVNGGEPEKTDISFLAPGTITAVWEDGVLTFYGVKDAEGNVLDPQKITLVAELESLVFVPQAYVDGVEGMLLETLTYFGVEIDEEVINTPDEIATELEDSVLISPALHAQYYVNPANASLDGFNLDFVVEENVDFIKTRAEASEDFKVEVAGWKVGEHKGRKVVDVELKVVGVPATEELISVVALEAKKEDHVVVSDYATLFNNEIAQIRIADPMAEAKKKGIADGDEHYRRATEGISNVDSEAYNTHAPYETATDLEASKATCDTMVVYTESLDLKGVVAAHSIDADGACMLDKGELSASRLEALGLEWKYELVENYEIGEPVTDQAYFVTLSEDGIVTPRVYDVETDAPIASVGRTPIFRVTLWDKNNEQAVQIAYVKVYIGQAEEEVTEETIDIPVGPAEFICNVDSIYQTTVEQMNKLIYQKVGRSKDDFHLVFEPNDEYNKKQDAEGIGTVEQVKNDETQGTYVLAWTIPADSLWSAIQAGKKEIDRKFQYIHKTNGGTVTIKLVAKISDFATSFNVSPGPDYIAEYWNDDVKHQAYDDKGNKLAPKSVVWFNVFTPDYGETDPTLCVFENDLNAAFVTWHADDKAGTPGVIKLREDKNGNVTSVKYFFCAAEDGVSTIKKIDGINVKFTVGANGDTLYATVNKVKEAIATIVNDGTDVPNYVVLNKESNIAKQLLNTNKLYTYIGATGYVCGTEDADEPKEVTITFDKKDHFRANFVRPIDITEKSADDFIDAVDFGEKGSFISFEELIAPIDWRNRTFVKYTNYWDYYGPFEITLSDDPIMCNLNGEYQKLPSTIIVATNNLKTMGEGSQKKTSKYGFITYRNNGDHVKPFDLFMKVSVKYGWGEIKTGEIKVHVNETIGDIN